MTTLDTSPEIGGSSRARGHASRCDDPGVTPGEEISTSDPPAFHERVRVWTAGQVEHLPRFVTERRPSLHEALAYARRGEWTAAKVGPARTWYVLHVWLITAPIKCFCAWVEWIAERAGRFWPALVIGVLLATALDPVPVVGWFVPDWAALTSWPPFKNIGG